VHDDLIELHLGKPLADLSESAEAGFAVSRWITTDASGRLDEVILPSIADPAIKYIEILKKPGDMVSFPYQNADRIGYVMSLSQTREAAEQVAEAFISKVIVKVTPL
jgi:hypothetical protein